MPADLFGFVCRTDPRELGHELALPHEHVVASVIVGGADLDADGGDDADATAPGAGLSDTFQPEGA